MQAESRAQTQRRGRNNEILSIPQRFGEMVSVAVVLLILGFYLYHQFANTGFFTTKFGGWEMFAFYGSVVLSFLPPLARAFIGRRNPVRPLEVFCNIFFAFASLGLLIVFPFNFGHFTAALPDGLRFLLSWVTNDMARAVLLLAFFGGLASAAYNIVRYQSFRRS